MCQEVSLTRRSAGRTGLLTGEERLMVAARIAALSVLGNYSRIWIELEPHNLPLHTIILADLAGQTETTIKGETFRVTEDAVRETLGTSLFGGSSQEGLVWSQRTHAEFLAAYYLNQLGLEVPQILSVLKHQDGYVLPQLYQMAAYIAANNKSVFYELLKTDLQVMLRVDPQATNFADRKALTQALLSSYAERKIPQPDWGAQTYYSRLYHPDLEAQLLPYLPNQNPHYLLVQNVVIDIAEECNLQGLENELAKIALQERPLEFLPIRVNAARAVARIGSATTKAALRPLVFGQAGPDPDNRLKGCGLLATWPAHLSTQELFNVIDTSEPSQGAFELEMFLASNQIVEHLQVSDLPLALDWVRGQSHRNEGLYGLANLKDEILIKAWRQLGHDELLQSFCQTVLAGFEEYDDLAGRKPADEIASEGSQTKRQAVLDILLPVISEPTSHGQLLLRTYADSPFITTSDIPWLLELLKNQTEDTKQVALAYLIYTNASPDDTQTIEYIYRAYKAIPIIAPTFANWFKPIKLKSSTAKQLKQIWIRQQKRAQHEIPGESKSFAQQANLLEIQKQLNEIEAGNLDKWCSLTAKLTGDPNTQENYSVGSNLSISPGWLLADEVTRQRILGAARKFVLKRNDLAERWLENNATSADYAIQIAGYKALRLLLNQAKSDFDNLEPTTWQNWTGAVLDYFVSHDDQEGQQDQFSLISRTYSQASENFLAMLARLIDAQNRIGYLPVLEKVKPCWDNRIAEVILSKIKDAALKPAVLSLLLDELFTQGVEAAITYIRSLIPDTADLLPSDDEAYSRIVEAALKLMIYQPEENWSRVWHLVEQDNRFAHSLISKLAHTDSYLEPHLVRQFPEEKVADLYIWLAKHYPGNSAVSRRGVITVTQDFTLQEYRDGLLRQLRDRGSEAACQAIERIVGAVPQFEWLVWTQLAAQVNTRRNTWKPYLPGQLLKLVSNVKLRLVHNGEELIEAITASLVRLEETFRSKTPAARDVWDAARTTEGQLIKGKFYPISENEFSDYIKRHLDDDFNFKGFIINRRVVINRETELRPSRGSNTGERTDIELEAVSITALEGSTDSIKLIIEVKGCWNKDLDTAMNTQLVNKYLKDYTDCKIGLYLIGWFNCDQWAANDNRRKTLPEYNFEEAR